MESPFLVSRSRFRVSPGPGREPGNGRAREARSAGGVLGVRVRVQVCQCVCTCVRVRVRACVRCRCAHCARVCARVPVPGGGGLAGPATGMRQLELPTVQRHPELSECTVNLTVRHLVRAKGHLNGPISPGAAEAAY